jgi:hypothetical protein
MSSWKGRMGGGEWERLSLVIENANFAPDCRIGKQDGYEQ